MSGISWHAIRLTNKFNSGSRNVRRIFAVAAIVLAAAILLLASGGPSVWNSMRPATCFPDNCFCEAVRDQLVRQPINAVSGLSFVGVGLLVLSRRRRQHVHTPTVSDGADLAENLFVIAAVMLGAGTVLYHASLTFVGQTLDVFGMYLLVTMIGLTVLATRWSMSARMTASSGIVINTFLLAMLIAAPEYRRTVFAGLVVLVIALESSVTPPRERGGRRIFWLAAAILGGGLVVWALDYARVACSPTSWLQGHAVWHLCGAAAVWLTMRYYAGHERQMTA